MNDVPGFRWMPLRAVDNTEVARIGEKSQLKPVPGSISSGCYPEG